MITKIVRNEALLQFILEENFFGHGFLVLIEPHKFRFVVDGGDQLNKEFVDINEGVGHKIDLLGVQTVQKIFKIFIFHGRFLEMVHHPGQSISKLRVGQLSHHVYHIQIAEVDALENLPEVGKGA